MLLKMLSQVSCLDCVKRRRFIRGMRDVRIGCLTRNFLPSSFSIGKALDK